MKKDLALDGGKYAWLLTVFYISYTLFEFQALMWKVLRPHQWAAFIMFAWYVPPAFNVGHANMRELLTDLSKGE